MNQRYPLYPGRANPPSARRNGSPRSGASALLLAEKVSNLALSFAGSSMARR